MSTNDIKHIAAETIYLVPDASEGQRCYLWCDDPAPGLDMDPSESVEYLRKDVHDAIIAKQANAAKSGMDAAKKVAGSNLEQAKRLHAECSPAALESEREANAVLTEQIVVLEQERDALAAHVDRLNSIIFRALGAIDDGDPNAAPYEEGRDAYNDTPKISLAKRDLIKQAEGAQMVSDDAKMRIEKANAIYPKFDNSGYRQCIYTADSVAADLRQRAQEINQ